MKTYDDLLKAALPLPREEFEAMKWLYSLPDNHAIFTDQQHPAYTQRWSTFWLLMENLREECETALIVRKKWEAYEKNTTE